MSKYTIVQRILAPDTLTLLTDPRIIIRKPHTSHQLTNHHIHHGLKFVLVHLLLILSQIDLKEDLILLITRTTTNKQLLVFIIWAKDIQTLWIRPDIVVIGIRVFLQDCCTFFPLSPFSLY